MIYDYYQRIQETALKAVKSIRMLSPGNVRMGATPGEYYYDSYSTSSCFNQNKFSLCAIQRVFRWNCRKNRTNLLSHNCECACTYK